MKARGFTLLEMTVALAVFGFLLLGLSQTLRFGLTAWHQDGRLSAGKTDLEAVDRTLRTIVHNFAASDGTGLPPISGSATTLVGMTRLRVPGSGTDPVRVEAGVALSGSRLVLRYRPHAHAEPLGGLPPFAETDLMDGVAHLTIAYWGSSGTWISQWHKPDLPLMIRFRISLTPGHSARWPDIVVAPTLVPP
jgi:general secretion pathway protein J